MNAKTFAQQAIKNGYTGSECKGWGWIRENLTELDHIFQLAEYKKQDGMKYKCTPFIYGEEELTDIEKSALDTAWFCNNEREHKRQKQEYADTMIKQGYIPLSEDICKQAFSDKKKLQISGVQTCDWLSVKIDQIYKPYVNEKGDCFLMKLKARSRGMSIYRLQNAFCKVI